MPHYYIPPLIGYAIYFAFVVAVFLHQGKKKIK